jgi:hypothetical protein
MSATDNETESGTERKEYELDGPRRVVRAELVIEEGETVELFPEEAEEHSDVLREVTDTDPSGSEEE